MIHIASYLAILIVGFSIGFSVRAWLVRRQKVGGVIYVIKGDEKLTYSLELEDDPEMLQFKKQVIFKVENSEDSGNRE
jgi:hypothetical protein